LSYPFVFEWQGTYYMIPETAKHRTIELYSSSPDLKTWRLERCLMQGVVAYDTTLYYDGRLWWLLACMGGNQGCDHYDELFLFSATDFRTDRWTPHPANPVVSDVTHARPAGALLRIDGKLYRPAQDCSGRYGNNLMLCEIREFDEEQYREVPVPFIEGPRPKRIVGTHTLNHIQGLSVIDVIQKRWKFGLASLRPPLLKSGGPVVGSQMNTDDGSRSQRSVVKNNIFAHEL